MSEKKRGRRNAVVATKRVEKTRRTLIQVAAASLLVALIASIGITMALKKSGSDNDNYAGPRPEIHAQSTAEGVDATLTSDGAIRIGKPGAKNTVRVVSDLQCPACQMFEQANSKVLEDEVDAGKTAVEYHVVSFLDQMSSGTRYSTRGANAAYVVAETNPAKFQTWLAAMYAEQPHEGGTGLTDDQMIKAATDAGITDPAVAQGITGHKYEGYVQRVAKDVAKSGVNATPTVLLNGSQLPLTNAMMLGPDGLRSAIERA